jgi:hypothetical protein
MDSDKLTKMFAKAHLLKFDDGEIQVLECVLGIAGSFYQSLFELYYKADYWNKMKLRKGFPEFVSAIEKYNNEPEYFEMKYAQVAEQVDAQR